MGYLSFPDLYGMMCQRVAESGAEMADKQVSAMSESSSQLPQVTVPLLKSPVRAGISQRLSIVIGIVLSSPI